MTKKILTTLGLLVIVAGTVWAEVTITLSPEEAFKQSDGIALIRILSVSPLPGNGKYAKSARAEVMEPVKGLHEKDVFDLDFDTSGIGANVMYAELEKAIVVLRRLPTGHYETMHSYCGKFSVEQGEVLDCNLLGEPGKVPASVSIDEAVRQLRVLVAESKEP